MIEVVEYKLVKRIRDVLELEMITNARAADPDDPAIVTDVKIGKQTDSPYGIHLTVHPDHPLGFASMDRLTSSAERKSARAERYLGTNLPGESFGGSKWRRFMGTVQIRSVLKNTSPEQAVGILALVKTRIAYWITNTRDLTSIRDAYGFQIWWVEMAEEYGYASGGGSTASDIHWCDFIAVASYRRVYP